MDSENGGTRPMSSLSRLKPPSVSAAAALQEVSESQKNVRIPQPSQLPTGLTGLKRQFPDQPARQPEAKRKTTNDRAGDFGARSIGPAAGSNIRPAPKGMSLANLNNPGPAHSRQLSNASRPPSTSNYGKSVGYGARPLTSHGERPQTSMSFSKSTNGRPRSHTRTRPVTAMGSHAVEDEPVAGKQQNGTMPPPSFFQPSQSKAGPLPVRKARARFSQSLSSFSIPASPTPRNSSLSSLVGHMDRFHIDERQADEQAINGMQVIPEKDSQVQPHPQQQQAAVPLNNVTVRSRRKEEAELPAPTDQEVQVNLVVPPPRTPVRVAEKAISDFESALNVALTPRHVAASPSPTKSHRPFLTKESNLRGFTAWDVDERLHEVEAQFKAMKEVMHGSLTDRKVMEDVIELTKTRGKRITDTEEVPTPWLTREPANDAERERDQLNQRNSSLQSELNDLRLQVHSLTLDLETERRSHQFDVEGRSREHQHELNELRRELKDETERAQREHREALEALERHYRAELDDERSQKSKEVDDLRTRLDSEQQDLHLAMQGKDREMQAMQSQIEMLKRDLEQEQLAKKNLQQKFAELSTTNMTLEDRGRALRAQIDFLESDSKQQSDSFASMEARLQEALKIAEEARQKLIKEETERRVLFNKYQELKGNIRVMCRVRPVIGSSEGEEAKLQFPDLKTSAQIDVTGPEEKSSLGVVSRKTIPFEFDRVFTPSVQNEDVFGEISQLVQSALDGYNVCIFCYGQTGSGKTYTMSSADGMIPRATHMIYDTITQLKEKSWSYTMEGSFVEVYNEELNDLLTSSRESDPKKKLEIRHDDARKSTTVVNCKTVRLDSPDMVETMLAQAQNNRSVAATKANERSSRSHSVFILRLTGENSATGERCEGTLNLVDLAGSERLKHSQAEGERMRETQNINKSLACLGDVIEALGRGSGHIPYRNSKLTHLLQYSLGGNSKTLMFVMVSPLEAHLKETITSLRFATKVHNTHIGTAKSTKKLKE